MNITTLGRAMVALSLSLALLFGIGTCTVYMAHRMELPYAR